MEEKKKKMGKKPMTEKDIAEMDGGEYYREANEFLDRYSHVPPDRQRAIEAVAQAYRDAGKGSDIYRLAMAGARMLADGTVVAPPQSNDPKYSLVYEGMSRLAKS